MKKILSVSMAIVMLLQVCVFAFADFNAPALTKPEWDELYGSLKDDNTLPMLCVGANESEVGLCWHADKDTAVAQVRLADNAEMNGAETFTGNVTEAENDEQVVCRVTVTGLKENSTYYYQWHTDNGWSKAYKYETKSFGDHKVMVVGDIQIGRAHV